MNERYEDVPEDVKRAWKALTAAGVDVEAFINDYLAAREAEATDAEVDEFMRSLPPEENKATSAGVHEPAVPVIRSPRTTSGCSTTPVRQSLRAALDSLLDSGASAKVALEQFVRTGLTPRPALNSSAPIAQDDVILSYAVSALFDGRLIQERLPWVGAELHITATPTENDPSSSDYSAFLDVRPAVSEQPQTAVCLVLLAPDGRCATVQLDARSPQGFFDAPLPSDLRGMELTAGLLWRCLK
jgi:hypothetical protein